MGFCGGGKAWRLRSVMTAGGFSEAVTFGFIERPAAELVVEADDIVAIANPLSETFAVLRPSLVPGLAAAVAHNRRRQRRDVRLFEVGNRFRLRAHVRRVSTQTCPIDAVLLGHMVLAAHRPLGGVGRNAE